MRERLYIQFSGQEPVQCQVLNGSGEPAAGVYRGGLQDIAHFAQGRQVVVIVTACNMLCYRPLVPRTSVSRLRQAVPYLLEDNLLSPVDDYHYALGQRDDSGQLPVTIVPLSQMQSWLGALHEAGIRPAMMVPDTLCLPLQQDRWTLYVDQTGIRIRIAQNEGYFAEWDNAELLMKSILAQTDSAVNAFTVYGEEEDLLACAARLDTLRQAMGATGTEAWQQYNAQLFQLCEQNHAGLPAVNLLQGRFKPKAQFDRQLGRWRLAAALLVGLLLLQLFSYMLGYWQLSREISWLDQHIELEIRNGFPEIKTIRQPLNQVNTALRELRRQAGVSQYHRLISAIGQASQAQSLSLQELNYRNQRMIITVQLPDLQAVNLFEQALGKQQGISAKVLSAKNRDKLVTARLEVSGERK